MCVEAKSLTELVGNRQRKYPSSGEINRKVDDVQATIARIEAKYADQAKHLDHSDGLGVEFDEWRFNIRGSNTEPLIRLNVESRGDPDQVRRATAELLALIEQS
jgi:phosphomannomutase/phosphomannomutase/phosphoglucomutase